MSELCKQAPYIFSLIAEISHHAAVTPFQKMSPNQIVHIFKLHVIWAMKQRKGKLTMNKSLSPVTYHNSYYVLSHT